MNQKSVVANKADGFCHKCSVHVVFLRVWDTYVCLGRITIDGSLGSQQWGVEWNSEHWNVGETWDESGRWSKRVLASAFAAFGDGDIISGGYDSGTFASDTSSGDSGAPGTY